MAGRFGYRALAGLIRDNFDSTDWYVRYHSLSALNLLEYSQTDRLALDALKDPNRALRIKGLEILAVRGGETAYPPIRERLGDESELVQAMAAFALGRMRFPRAVPDLVEKLSSPRKLVSNEAHAALRKITGLDYPPDPEIWTNWWRDRGDRMAETE